MERITGCARAFCRAVIAGVSGGEHSVRRGGVQQQIQGGTGGIVLAAK